VAFPVSSYLINKGDRLVTQKRAARGKLTSQKPCKQEINRKNRSKSSVIFLPQPGVAGMVVMQI
jgi:hypothetical protein